jgi:hypothetical protein
MAGGHCYGFSVLANLIWQGKLTATSYGAASPTALQIDSNQGLQREIAYDWALQTLDSVQSQRISGTPNKILTTLMSVLKQKAAQAYTIVFWKRDNTGGHAVTPYAVESKGGGKYDVLIYDNNWPGETRAISFDTKANTWNYNASTNPNEPASQYEGDAGTKTISLDPVSPGLGTQPCPFCGRVPKSVASSSEKSNTEEITLTGTEANQPDLLVTDSAGHKIGYVGGKFVDEIHGARDDPVISQDDWSNKARPNFFVPADQKYTITLDGSGLSGTANDTLTISGPSYDVAVKNIQMSPGERDTLVTEPDATHLSYTASRPETPTFEVGVSDVSADYSFMLSGVSDQPGSTFNLSLPPEGSTLELQNVGSKVNSTVDFQMTRETEQGVQTFDHNGIPLVPSDEAVLAFGDWTGPSQPIPMTTTHDGQQSTLDLENQQAG